jgi:hypothetical protein
MREVPRAIGELMAGADHVDVKTVEGDQVDLRAFVAGMYGYWPRWLAALYVIRRTLVRLIGLRDIPVTGPAPLTADTLPTTPGAKIGGAFEVRVVEEGRLWVAEADDRHLRAALGVVAEPAGPHRQRLHVLTVVHYKHWTAPLYFNLIRPFHHLVVGAMMRAGLRAATR